MLQPAVLLALVGWCFSRLTMWYSAQAFVVPWFGGKLSKCGAFCVASPELQTHSEPTLAASRQVIRMP
jgi:hypothetical protein